jgi:fumarylacetoacetate (FAA) hydrolase
VALGTTAAEAGAHIKLVLLANDLTLRETFARNVATGGGFFQGKPCRSFAPFAVTPDELGDAWSGGRLHARLECQINGVSLGTLDPSCDSAFSFDQIIAHMATTRGLSAGTIIGSGTVSNRDGGYGCLAEPRALERAATGEPSTPWLHAGDRVRIEAFAADNTSIFGALDQEVVAP